jgi:hypothetical protein
MRELTNKSASIACELAALLMVVEECDVDQVERENLISLARRVSDQLAASMVEQNSTGRSMDNFYTYRSKKICCYWRKKLPRFCHVLLTLRLSEGGRAYPCNEFNGLAQRLSDELANSLDISTFSDPESQEAKHDQQCEV